MSFSLCVGLLFFADIVLIPREELEMKLREG
jgi:hypothetical protein